VRWMISLIGWWFQCLRDPHSRWIGRCSVCGSVVLVGRKECYRIRSGRKVFRYIRCACGALIALTSACSWRRWLRGNGPAAHDRTD
jgi:hypothetical protein